jgi:hypothetical protein
MLHLLGDRRSSDGRFHWFWILCWQRVKTWSLCRRIGWRCSGQRWHVVVFLEGPARLSIAPAVLENLRAPPPPRGQNLPAPALESSVAACGARFPLAPCGDGARSAKSASCPKQLTRTAAPRLRRRRHHATETCAEDERMDAALHGTVPWTAAARRRLHYVYLHIYAFPFTTKPKQKHRPWGGVQGADYSGAGYGREGRSGAVHRTR